MFQFKLEGTFFRTPVAVFSKYKGQPRPDNIQQLTNHRAQGWILSSPNIWSSMENTTTDVCIDGQLISQSQSLITLGLYPRFREIFLRLRQTTYKNIFCQFKIWGTQRSRELITCRPANEGYAAISQTKEPPFLSMRGTSQFMIQSKTKEPPRSYHLITCQ